MNPLKSIIKGLSTHSKTSYFAKVILLIIVLIGLLGPYIATSKPLYVKYQGEHLFPAFSNKKFYNISSGNGTTMKLDLKNTEWKYLLADKKVFAPIPYSPGRSDYLNASYQPPFSQTVCNDLTGNPITCKMPFKHWLGTNLKGEDLLSGLINGTGISLKIGFLSILLTLIIGSIVGLLAGFYSNDTLPIRITTFAFLILSVLPCVFYSQLVSEVIGTNWWLQIILISLTIIAFITISSLLGFVFDKVFKMRKRIYLPVDAMLSRMIEIFTSVPRFIILMGLAVVLDRSVSHLILIIGITSWTGIARLVRAETLKMRNLDYITSARALGLSNMRILRNHIFPGLSNILLVAFVFGMSGAILLESGLSFLNIGVPEDVVTWGQLMADGRKNFQAWWMVLFPGLAIFLTVFSLNILGESIQSNYEKKVGSTF